MQPNARPNGGRTPSLELHLGNAAYAGGQRLTGVATLRAAKPICIRELTVSLEGSETARGPRLPRSLRKPMSFFRREVLLSGMVQPAFAAEQASLWWNAFLGRDKGHCVAYGEHIYPFSILLPASLPPSYSGSAGSVGYTVAARLRFPLGNSIRASGDVLLAAGARAPMDCPVNLDYPDDYETGQSPNLRFSLVLPSRAVESGGVLAGQVNVDNPDHLEIPSIGVCLQRRESVASFEKAAQWDWVVSTQSAPVPTASAAMQHSFGLRVPEDAAPTVDGTNVSVEYILKVVLNTDTRFECATPITVCRPLPDR